MQREQIVREALLLLDQVGLDGVTTRQLARRLGVEQPALYWHFAKKTDLLEAMAMAAMGPHAARPLPCHGDDWSAWFAANVRSLRSTLLQHRDGARLHAGSRPDPEEASRIEAKLAFLTACGFTEQDALMALLAAARFTLGCVLEEQADQERSRPAELKKALAGTGRAVPDHDIAFEAGLSMLIDGLGRRQAPAR